MNIVETLRKVRLNALKSKHEEASVELWSSIWNRASTEIRHELARQIAESDTPYNQHIILTIDDPMFIAELADLYENVIDSNGNPVTLKSVQNKLTLRILPQARVELASTAEVRCCVEREATRKANEIAHEIEAVLKNAWPHHIKVRTRSRFIIEGYAKMPDASKALNVFIIESSGHTSRELLPVDSKFVERLRTVTGKFQKCPSIIVALGAKAKREVWVVPHHIAELSPARHF